MLRKVSTLFLSEDHKEAPAARPAGDGNAVTCPWCKYSFVEVMEGGSDPGVVKDRPGGNVVEKEQKPNPSERTEAQKALSQFAASILMKILYVARMARLGLLRPTCRLACFITCWTPLIGRNFVLFF